MAYRSQDIVRRSATGDLTPMPQARDFQEGVTKPIDVTTCIGREACQVAYSEWNGIRDTVGNNIGVYDNFSDLSAKSWTIMRFSEVEQNDKLERLIRKDGYMHCSDPGCLKACSTEGAIIQYANGIVDFQPEQYIDCSYCIVGCPPDTPRPNPKDNHVYKCTLCVDRVVVGQEPARVKTCPTGVIHSDTKESVKTLASERTVGLKTCGYDDAGPYGPASVDGAYVMYVLHHTDEPNLYHGLSEDPEISETVKSWKGIQKPLTAVGFAATSATSIFHHVGVDPNRADEGENDLHEGKDEEHK